MTIIKRSLDNVSQPQSLSPEQAVTELARFLPASQYASRLDILSVLADGQMICTNFSSYQMQADSKSHRTNPQTTDYTLHALSERSFETMLSIRRNAGCNCKRISCFLRVSNGNTCGKMTVTK